MESNNEVVGWVLVDDSARVLVRKENGNKAPTLSAEQAFEHFAIQTGTFRRKRIIDSVTRLALAHEVD